MVTLSHSQTRSYDLEYMDNFVPLNEDARRLKAFYDRLDDHGCKLGMDFAPSKCKLSL